MAKAERADLVVVGAGMVGGWASWFAADSGADRVIVLERDLAGQGASSRAAGVVRAQGGTRTTVALGRFSIDFYRSQHARHRDRLRVPRARVSDPRGDAARCARRERARGDAAHGRSGRAVGRRGRGVRAQPDPRGRGTPRRELLRDGRGHRSSAERARVLAGDATSGCATARADAVPRSANGGRARRPQTRHRRGDARRSHQDGARDPDGWAEPSRGRRARGGADLRRRRAAPGGRHRAASGVRRRAPAHGLRRRRRDLLATGGGRVALGHVEPEGDTRAGTGGRLAVPAADAAATEHAGADDEGPRHPQSVVRDDRLHARPPADLGSGRSPRMARRSKEQRSLHPAATA